MYKIAINAGHAPYGIPDPGAVNKNLNLRECDVARNIAFALSAMLEGSGYETMIIQDDDLQIICDNSNGFEADYFISLHCNDYVNIQAHGSEVYCYTFGGEGEQLARSIQTRLVRDMKMSDRGVREANFYVLRHTECPAVLVEMGFINNPQDADKLMNNQDDFAEAIYQGVIMYLEE